MINFSLRELECFTAVAEELSFTAAARRLNLSQPPLSRHIRALEQRLGKTLFERSKRHVALTAAGRTFLKESDGILALLARAQESVREADSRYSESIDVGFVSALLSDDLAECFLDFKKRRPETRLSLHDCLPAEQLESLRAGKLDIGFVGMRPERRSERLAFRVWRRRPLVALMGKSHPLADARSLVVDELEGVPLVAVSRRAAPDFLAFIRRCFAKRGLYPNITQEADRAQAVALMAIAGDAVALLSESAAAVVEGGVAIPITHANRKPILVEEVVAFRKTAPSHVRRSVEVLLRRAR